MMTWANVSRGRTGLAALLALLAALLPAQAEAAASKVKLDLHVMSLCPYGLKAENGVLPAVKSLAKQVDFNLYFIGSSTTGADGMPQFRALHGAPEVAENIRQVCAMKLSPDKFMDYILERNKAVHAPEWKDAARAAKLSAAQIAKMEECANGPQGAAWYSKNIESSQARNVNASPTVFINDAPYTRARTQGWVTLALCDALKAAGAALPAACKEATALAANEKATGADEGCGGAIPSAPSGGQQAAAPAPTAFDITVVAEQSCKLCAPTLLNSMAVLHPGAKVRTVDADSKEGQELIKTHGAKTLPLYILDSKVEREANFQRLLQSAYYKSRDSYLIRHGANNFFPNVQLARKRMPRHLDVFLESLSLASAQAEQDLIRFLIEDEKNLKDLTISFHFVVSESAVDKTAAAPKSGSSVRAATLAELPRGTETALVSSRGDAEIREDIRQLCVFQHKPIGTLFTYLACRNRNLGDAQQAQRCLQPADELKNCIEKTEGKNLLRQDAKLAHELELSRAPVFLWENRYGPFSFNEVDWRNLLRGSTPSQQAEGKNSAAGKGG
ncbi:MAG: thioredoxin domain-containing protein [Elusimicrobia bacterium]|nr:thioredoxin domain-containing protein [Elusimicrobiota bacterium]